MSVHFLVKAHTEHSQQHSRNAGTYSEMDQKVSKGFSSTEKILKISSKKKIQNQIDSAKI